MSTEQQQPTTTSEEELTPSSPLILTYFSTASSSLGYTLTPPREVFAFGDNPHLNNTLLSLVLSRKKTAMTSWPIPDPLTWSVGDYSCVLNGDKQPCAIIKTVELVRCRFNEVTEDMARDEGEDDGSLEMWRQEHLKFFGRQEEEEGGQVFGEDSEVLFERFAVVWPVSKE